MHHGVIFCRGSAKVCSSDIYEKAFSLDKDIWIAATDYYLSPAGTGDYKMPCVRASVCHVFTKAFLSLKIL